MCYKICELALKRHMLHTHKFGTCKPAQRHQMRTHTHTLNVSLHSSIFSSSQLLFPNGQQGLRKCDSYPICGQQIIFSCCKSFTRVSCHASPQRCQNTKPQTSSNHRGQMRILNVKNKEIWPWNVALSCCDNRNFSYNCKENSLEQTLWLVMAGKAQVHNINAVPPCVSESECTIAGSRNWLIEVENADIINVISFTSAFLAITCQTFLCKQCIKEPRPH